MDGKAALAAAGLKDGSIVIVMADTTTSTTSKRSGMQIIVVTLTGKSTVIDVSPLDTVADVKQQVQKRTGISAEQRNLGFEGKDLDGEATLLLQGQRMGQWSL